MLRVADIDRFAQAGEAACLLEELGFVAVARKKDGEVSLELWRLVGTERRLMKYVITSPYESADALAKHCVQQFGDV